MSKLCPCCKTKIDAEDVLGSDPVPGEEKYFNCPTCGANLIVTFEIARIDLAEDAEEMEEAETTE